jgi:hypothetical protein
MEAEDSKSAASREQCKALDKEREHYCLYKCEGCYKMVVLHY